MDTFRVDAVSVTIRAGIVELDEAQAKRRAGFISKNEDGSYTVNAPIGFKKGEVFGYDGEVNRAMLTLVSPLGEVELPKEAEVIKSDTAEYPIHEGAGWYRLSDGEKLRGKKDAEALQAKLNELA